MTTKEVAILLGDTEQKHTRKSKGQFKHWSSYYWGFTATGETLVKKVKEKIPTAEITGYGNHFHGFVGGRSGSAQDSYLWVTFTVPDAKAQVEAGLSQLG